MIGRGWVVNNNLLRKKGSGKEDIITLLTQEEIFILNLFNKAFKIIFETLGGFRKGD